MDDSRIVRVSDGIGDVKNDCDQLIFSKCFLIDVFLKGSPFD